MRMEGRDSVKKLKWGLQMSRSNSGCVTGCVRADQLGVRDDTW